MRLQTWRFRLTNGTALLVIDVQTGMFEETAPVFSGVALLKRIQGLIAKARDCEVPVIYVQHNAGVGTPLEPHTPGWYMHSMIAPVECDIIVNKTPPDAFHETNLKSELESRGIRQLVVAGIQTELCVDPTCRRAFSLEYDVIVAKDAHSTWNRGNLTATEIIEHHNDVLTWFADMKDAGDIVFCDR